MIHVIHVICFILLIAVALFAFIPRIRPTDVDLVAAAIALIGIAYTASLALARHALLLAFCAGSLLLTSCGVTVRTPYGDVSYDQPVKYDGKTALR